MEARQSFGKTRNIEASILKKIRIQAQWRAASVGVRSKTVCKGMREEFLGEKYIGEKYMGEESVGEKYMVDPSVGEKYMGEKYVQEEFLGEESLG